jgi:hypothetical protein
MTNLTTDQVIAEWIWTALAVKQVIGKIPRYIRPPYGDTDTRTNALFQAFGFKKVMWNVLLNDTAIPVGDLPVPGVPPSQTWRIANATNMLRNIVNHGMRATGSGSFLPDTGGFISLEHELNMEQFTLAQEALRILSGSGRFRFVSSAFCVTNGRVTDANDAASKKQMEEEMYFRDDEPFAKFLNGIQLPMKVGTGVTTTPSTSNGTGSGGSTSKSGGVSVRWQKGPRGSKGSMIHKLLSSAVLTLSLMVMTV